jgi:hypothetical protein
MTYLQAFKRGVITSAGFFLLLCSMILISIISMIYAFDFNTFLMLYLIVNILILLTHIPLTIWRERNRHFKSDVYEDKLVQIENKIDLLLQKL